MTENSRMKSEKGGRGRGETGGTRAHDENQTTQTFAEQLSRNFIDSAAVHSSNGKLGKFAYPASLG